MPETHAADTEATRFMGWRDLIITPAVEASLLAAALVPALLLRSRYELSTFVTAVLAYSFLVAHTLLALKLLRTAFPKAFAPGVHVMRRSPWGFYFAFNLYGFLVVTNLFLQSSLGAVPPPFRSVFYWLLGSKVGRGLIVIAGKVVDPHLLKIGSGATIGEEALVLCHGLNSVGGEDVLVLGKVVIGEGAVIGARSVLMPGVTVGERATVTAMSFVPMGTQIPAHETWGGSPAKKISSQRPRVSQAKAVPVSEVAEAADAA